VSDDDMVPYRQKPVVNMDDALLELRNLLGLTALDLQRFALHYREADHFELAEFTTQVIRDLDHRLKMLRHIPADYQRRIENDGI